MAKGTGNDENCRVGQVPAAFSCCGRA